jgi:hypothetical protein
LTPARVINDESEGDGVSVVMVQAGSVGSREVTSSGKVFLEMFIGKDASLLG